jgi:hypothetical protein
VPVSRDPSLGLNNGSAQDDATLVAHFKPSHLPSVDMLVYRSHVPFDSAQASALMWVYTGKEVVE